MNEQMAAHPSLKEEGVPNKRPFGQFSKVKLLRMFVEMRKTSMPTY